MTAKSHDQEQVSKSQVKRELLALQQLGERLIGLSPKEWEQFELGPDMLEALEESRRIKGHNAMRRHVRRVGKLLREEDGEFVHAIIRRIDRQHLDQTRHFHLAEQWRDRLLAEGDDALEGLLAICPTADRQRLRQLIRSAGKAQEGEQPPAARRKLFRYLRELELD